MRGGIRGIFDRDEVRGRILAVVETGDAKDPVAIGAGKIAAEGGCDLFEHESLAGEVEAFDAPEHLVLAGRCREDGGSWRHAIRCPKRSEPGIAVFINIE